jgi:uncharacterized protein involved in type VI secretion and phage assembly
VSLSLYETIQSIVRHELERLHIAELAVVQEQHSHAGDSDSDNYACSVRMRNSGVVLKHVPVATARVGVASIPAVGDLVLVQFIGGDFNAPVIIGSLYNDEDRPPINAPGQSVMHLPLGASDDDAVHIDLQSGDTRSLLFRLGSGIEVNIRDDDPVVEVSVDDGKAKVQIDRDGAITIDSQAKVTLKGDEISVQGNTIKIEAQSQLVLKGQTVDIN